MDKKAFIENLTAFANKQYKRGDPHAANAVEPQEPSPAELAANFVIATKKWSAAGFPVVPGGIYQARAAACEDCKLWDGAARLGLGKCNHKGCGCTKFKRWLATENCPIGRWPV